MPNLTCYIYGTRQQHQHRRQRQQHQGHQRLLNYLDVLKRMPTRVKNPQANGIFEGMHQVLRQMLHIAEIDMANSVTPDGVDVFLDNAAWAICSTYHTVFKASPGAAIFGHNMLFNILFVADRHKIGEWRQSLTDCGNQRKNAKCVD